MEFKWFVAAIGVGLAIGFGKAKGFTMIFGKIKGVLDFIFGRKGNEREKFQGRETACGGNSSIRQFSENKSSESQANVLGQEAEKEKKLRNELLRTERKLWEIKMLRPYEKIFERSALALQTLLGLKNVPLDTLTGEKIDYYMWDMILAPLDNAVRDAGGRIEKGLLVLPDSSETFEEKEIRNRLGEMDVKEMEMYLRENELRIQSVKIAEQKADVVKNLAGVIERLQSLERKKEVKDEDICQMAEKVQKLLENSGIYPMEARDDRLKPELKKRFIPLKKYAIKYPGLFIRWGNEWEVLGSNIGMDDWEG
jgi:hypothetical protein